MTDSLKLAEMQRTSIEFERQRHLANWFIKSSPHMATPPPPPPPATSATTATATAAHVSSTTATTPAISAANGNSTSQSSTPAGRSTPLTPASAHSAHNSKYNSSNPVFFLMTSNGNTGAMGNGPGGGKHCGSGGGSGPSPTAMPPPPPTTAMGGPAGGPLGHFVDGRKPKLRRFNSHDTSSNMFSVADFENARLARRNENEMKQRLQRRMRMSANGNYAGGGGVSGNGFSSMSGDYSTGDSKASKYSNDSQHEPLPADIFLDRYSLPRVVRISYKTKFSDETLQSSSSNGSSTVTSTSNSSASGTAGMTSASNNHNASGNATGTSSSTASSSGGGSGGGGGHNNNTTGTGGSAKNGSAPSPAQTATTAAAAATATATATTATIATTTSNGSNDVDHQEQGELFLLYRLIRQRHIYHGHNAKTTTGNRKKGVLIPQEFPGYFSLLNDKSLPTATLYTSLIQLVRERVYKFVSVDNMPAFTESQPNANNPPPEGCLPIYSPPPPPTSNRPQYVKTTARGGQVYRLLAVFEDGKQDHNAIGSNGGLSAKPSANHGREKEKGRYAQLLNENRQVLYVSLSTKGKYYEIEPGIPQILQKLGGISNDANKKINVDCVHRITALVTPNRELPLTLRYISGPSGCVNAIPENVCITRITTENVVIACPIEDVEMQSPLHLRKLHLTKEMNLLKSSLGFESEQRMFANPNVQNILKFCQFNCDQFLKMVEVEILNRSERSGSKSRVDGLKILKPLHLPKLLRREKTTISAHEKEDSIIFLSKSDLANLEAKESASASAFAENPAGSSNRISEKMKVFQTSKKKWFRKQDKHSANSLTSFDLDVQVKRMSMERYSDMSKLLQERFGDKSNANVNAQEHESISEPSGASDIGCSDTETTTLATIDEKLKKFGAHSKATEPTMHKSMSLQDIELIGGSMATRKPDLLPTHHNTADTISEAGTDLEDVENQAPLPQSFITEKLYNEFHVKTRQYSKSSSSLHQLLNFSLPQKLQIGETKRSLAQVKHVGGSGSGGGGANRLEKRLDFNIGEPVMGRRAAGGLSLLATGSSATSANSQNTSLISPLTPTSLIEDDLPYSNVRDSLIFSSDESAADNPAGNICQALNRIDYTQDNIYAEICHDASAMGGIPTSHTHDTFSGETNSTQVSDDYGDYASLTYSTAVQAHVTASTAAAATATSTPTTAGNAISRVQINCSSSPVSYHTVYLGDEPLGESYAAERRRTQRELPTERIQAQNMNPNQNQGPSQNLNQNANANANTNGNAIHQDPNEEEPDRAHITTVELEGATHGATSGLEGDNIYNTLK